MDDQVSISGRVWDFHLHHDVRLTPDTKSSSYPTRPDTLLSGKKRLECDIENTLPSKPRLVMRLRLFPHVAFCRVNNSTERLLYPYVSKFIQHERGYKIKGDNTFPQKSVVTEQ
jgi:hypothetical protein